MTNCELWERKIWWSLQHTGRGAQASAAQVPAHSDVKCWAWWGQWFSTWGLQNPKWSVNSFPKGLQKDKSEKRRSYLLYLHWKLSNLQTKESWGPVHCGLLLTRTGGNVHDSKQWKMLRNWKWVHKPLSKSVHQHGNKKKIEIACPSCSTFS